jgi:hypothetical protein
MSDTSKKILRTIGFGILWVFILSIHIKGHTLFYYANGFFVQNRLVAAVDSILSDGYDAVAERVATMTGNGHKY